MKNTNNFKVEELEQRLEMKKWADRHPDLDIIDDAIEYNEETGGDPTKY